MNTKEKMLISDIIEGRMEGDSCIETAEYYEDDVKKVDTKLYSALRRLNEAADDMINRLRDLNEDLELGHDTDYI